MKPRLFSRPALALAAAALWASACTRDLTLPEPPERGQVRGSVDVGDHIPAVDNDVTLVSEEGSRSLQQTLADGSFVFADVAPGVYYVQLALPGFAPLLLPNVRVRSGQTVDVGELAPAWLGASSLLVGKVAVNGGGSPQGGQVEFLLQPVNQRVALAAIGADGGFAQRVPPGTYTLRASHPQFVTAEQDGVSVAEGEERDLTATPIVMELNPATLTGTVLRERDGLASVPAAGALVTLTNGATTTTDGSGAFILTGLGAGAQGARVALAGYHDPNPDRAVLLQPGATSALGTLTLLLDRGSVAGRVALSDGQEATNVTVAVTGTPYNAQVTPDPATPGEGSFVIAGVPVGVYGVTASKAGYSKGSASTLTVAAEATISAGTLSLTRLTGTLTLDDADATNAPGHTAVTSLFATFSNLSNPSAVRLSEDPTFAGVSFQPYTSATVAFALSGGEGTHTVHAQYQDGSGAVSEVFSATIVLDTEPPSGSFSVVGTLASGETSSTATANPTVTVFISQAGASEYLLGDESLTSCPGAGYSAIVASGISHLLTGAATPRKVHLCLRDPAGNTAGPLVQEITLDTATPTGCAVTLAGTKVDGSAAPAGLTAATTVTASISGCTETPAELFLSSAPVTCSSTASLPWSPFGAASSFLLTGADGLQTVHGCVRDAAHNVGALTAGSITLDTQPPAAPVVTLDSGAAYVNAELLATRGTYWALATGFASGATEWALSASPEFGAAVFSSFTSGDSAPFDFGASAEGTRTVYALFRDAVGNSSPVAQDEITFDTQAPSIASASLSIQTSTSNEYTSSVSVLLSLVAPSDAVNVRLGNDTFLDGCEATDVQSVNVQPIAAAITHLLNGGDGLKRVCLQLLDAAGNASSFLGDTVTLDTTPPAAPVIVTPSAIVNGSQVNPYVVQTATNGVTDTSFARYEQVGGELTAWTTASTSISATSFNFNLVESSAFPAGRPNLLQLRAVDHAGNASAVASVLITKDTSAPLPATTDITWINNADGQATLYWTESASADVVSYNLHYGASSTRYNGTYAVQGPSPVSVSAGGQFTLSGLVNGAPTYVVVRPVDHAGNEGSASTEVVLQPNIVSPTQIATVVLSGADPGYLSRFAIQGDILYAIGFDGDCNFFTAQGAPALFTFDLSRIVHPFQGGVRQSSNPVPTELGKVVLSDLFDCSTMVGAEFDLAVEGPYAFVVIGTKLRIFDVADPAAPALLTTLDFAPNELTSMQVRGDYAFLSGNTGLISLDVGALYDGDATTLPTTADVVGTATNSVSTPRGLVWSRSTLLPFDSFGTVHTFTGFDSVTGAAITPVRQAVGSFGQGVGANPRAAGNYVYVSENNRFAMYDLTTPWAGGALSSSSPLASLTLSTRGQFDVQGGEAFVNDNDSQGIRILDLSSLSDGVGDYGFTRVNQSAGVFANVTYGNYLMAGDALGNMLVYEIAQPRSLRRLSTASTGEPHAAVQNGLLVSGGLAMDLHAGWPPPALNTDADPCFYDAVTFGEVTVMAQGERLRVADLAKATDRDTGTTVTGADSYTISLPAGVSATGVAAYGTKLVVAEQRPDGTWLEVFDARPLLDREPATQLALPAAGNDFFVTSTAGRASVSLHRGRALIALEGDPPSTAAGPGLFVVDLRALLDDDSTTTMKASDYLGTVPSATPCCSFTVGARQVVGRGDYAYVASNAGLEIIDISEAMQEPPLALGSTGAINRALSTLVGAQAVAVHGAYALVVPLSGQVIGANVGIQAVDISNPLSPVVVGSLPFIKNSSSCIPSGLSTLVRTRAAVAIGGSRAYVTGPGYTWVLELE